MGCASSAPLVEQGKHLVEGVKDTANDTMAKGEKALHETTDTIKEGISSGIDTMKETVQSAFTTAEESVGSVAHKLGETLSFTTSKTAENLKNDAQMTTDLSAANDETLRGTVDAAAEAVSEAETVVMSEAEPGRREAFQSGTSPFFETVHSLGDEVDSTLANTAALAQDKAEGLEVSMHHTLKQGGELLEDLETDAKDMLGESVQTMKAHVEELHEGPRPDKEESAPTFWEAAADAILMKKTIKGMDPAECGQERIFYSCKEKADLDNNGKTIQANDFVVENTDN